MPRAVSSVLHRLCWISLLILVLSAPAIALEPTLIDFKIKDQFDNEHRDEDYRGEIICLIGSDRDGSDFNRLWGKAIADSLAADPGEAGERVIYLPVAHMKGVPFFLKGMVKGKFPKDEKRWILLDWKGKFYEAYAFAPGESNIIIFDGEGRRLARAHGKEPDERQLGILLAELRNLLKE